VAERVERLKHFLKNKIRNHFMCYWLHDLEGDDEGYWQEYLETVLPGLKK
jgi:hypothetical protein